MSAIEDGFAIVINFIINSSLISSFLVILILAVKWVLKNRISSRWHYILWFTLLLRLAVPYMVYSPLRIPPLNTWINLKSIATTVTLKSHILQSQSNLTTNAYTAAFMVWLSGVIILTLYFSIHNALFWSSVKNGKVFTDHNIISLLEESKEKLGIHTNVSIIQTSGISIPALFGTTRPWLLVPEKVLKTLDYESLRYIILHELAHLKRKDIVVNWIALILQILHWFNPFIWLAFHYMRVDRELACDETVLMHLEHDEIKKYGHTILDMVELLSGRIKYAGIAGILEDKSQIRTRISRISAFKSKSSKHPVLSIVIVITLGSSIIVNAGNITTDIKDSTIIHSPSELSTSIPLKTESDIHNITSSENIVTNNAITPETSNNDDSSSKSKANPKTADKKGLNQIPTKTNTIESPPKQQESNPEIENAADNDAVLSDNLNDSTPSNQDTGNPLEEGVIDLPSDEQN